MKNLILKYTLAFIFTSCIGQFQTTNVALANEPQEKHLKSIKPIKDSYIVVLNDNVQVEDFAAAHNHKVKKIYREILNGLHMKITVVEAEILSRDPDVEFVEQDSEGETSQVQTGATWGIDRVDQRNLPLDGIFKGHD